MLLGEARGIRFSERHALPQYDGVILIDGVRATVRAVGRPCVLQLVGPRGDVRATYYLRHSDPLPRWDPPPTLALRLLPEPRAKPSVSFAVAAGGTVLAAGGLYAFGGVIHAKFVDPTTPYEDLPGLQTQTNAVLGGSIALAATAAVLTTLTFLEW